MKFLVVCDIIILSAYRNMLVTQDDMDNDGILNAKDCLAILKDFLEIENGANPLVADFNGDGYTNAKDAAAILKRIVGLA